jgi:hypothetical protein
MKITEFRFSHSGSSRDEIYSYEVSEADSGILIHIEYGAGYLVMDKISDASVLDTLGEIVIRNEIVHWDGFDGSTAQLRR